MRDLGVVDYAGLKQVRSKTSSERKKYKRFKYKFIFELIAKPFKEVWKTLCGLYYDVWNNRRTILKISTIVFIIYTIFIAIKIFFEDLIFLDGLKYIGKAILLFLSTKLIVYAIHWMFGYQMLIAKKRELSDLFVNEKLAKIAKISGATGAGKDTFMRYVGTSKRKYLIKKLTKRMEYIKKTIYYVSFIKYEELIQNDVDKFEDKSKSKFANLYHDKLVRVIANLFRNNQSLIKDKYILKYSATDMIYDYSEFKKAPRFYKSKYVFNEKINSSHVLDLLTEYANLYFRLFIDKHFIMTNQPTIEDLKEKIMCKQFSLDYFKLIHDEFKRSTQAGTQVMKEKVIFGLTENLIILESEVDSFYNNLDKSVNSELLKSGVRDAFAYNRHLFGEDFSYYQVGQNASRCASLMRELTHEFIYIQSKKTIDGGRLRNILLYLIKFPFDFVLSLNDLFYEYQLKKMKLRKEYLIKKYNLKYYSSHNEKWKIKSLKLEKTKYPTRKGLYGIAERFTAWCERTIQKNKNDGWIEMKIALSKNANSSSDQELSLKQIVKKDLNVTSGVVSICFKRTDSHGLYDTHYLRTLKKNLTESSEVNFYNANIWDNDMLLKKDDAIYIDYKSMDNFFNITKEERKNHSYNVYYEEEGK